MRFHNTISSFSFRLGAAAIAAGSALLLSGCGGSMGSSVLGWGLSGFTAYGSPTVTVTPVVGAAQTGGFAVTNSTSTTTVNQSIFLEATYFAEVPNVNAAYYTSATPQAVGSFTTEWSEVLPTPTSTPRVTFNSNTGTTFSGNMPSPTPNVQLNGESGNFITVSSPGPVTIKLHVTLQASDGSSRSKDFYTTLNITPAAS